MRRQLYLAPVFMIVMGIAGFFSVANRPSFQAYRAVDVITLIGVGMVFGAAIVSAGFTFRGRGQP
jgi:hypothetical protein